MSTSKSPSKGGGSSGSVAQATSATLGPRVNAYKLRSWSTIYTFISQSENLTRMIFSSPVQSILVGRVLTYFIVRFAGISLLSHRHESVTTTVGTHRPPNLTDLRVPFPLCVNDSDPHLLYGLFLRHRSIPEAKQPEPLSFAGRPIP
ncbi:hypothetical protein PIIN_10146 [Serendipita indica DSM 11827]|uniref:Uncharacterized protein n=1 Tax=Serendipita indica (strain DSM 11827) TaxID=1109443 RepID=G4TXV3_SERID|nr:hypothetical protein PIIN_10146 [Serendipita indica DSM 11827]